MVASLRSVGSGGSAACVDVKVAMGPFLSNGLEGGGVLA